MFFKYRDQTYPDYIKIGPGSRYIENFAKEFCKGHGLNIGYGTESGKIFLSDCEYKDIKNGQDCSTCSFIPDNSLNFIFSSHTLEHLDDWKYSLKNWLLKIKNGGCLFLYLPHYTMEYWRPENNTKHKHIIFQEDIEHFMRKDLSMKNIFITGKDLYWSYCVVGFKAKTNQEETGLVPCRSLG